MTDRKKEIIATAATLFRKKGYTAVSMRSLAEEIGIRAASLYNHIESKQEILEHIILGVADRFTDGMRNIQSTTADPLEKIRRVILLHIEITLSDPEGMESLQNNWMYLEGKSMSVYKTSRNDYEEQLRRIVHAGIASGHLRSVNPELLIYSMLSTLRYLYIWYPRQEGIDPENLKEEMMLVILRGMGK
ncbi:TetR family transcriptional regulator [Lewinellaceae bacterium SD302]|nr:TetR family transcriptional regulator [Lewinellaceae bacterium SD302]